MYSSLFLATNFSSAEGELEGMRPVEKLRLEELKDARAETEDTVKKVRDRTGRKSPAKRIYLFLYSTCAFLFSCSYFRFRFRVIRKLGKREGEKKIKRERNREKEILSCPEVFI